MKHTEKHDSAALFTEEISHNDRAELELRLKELDEHPEKFETFEEDDLNRLFKEFADARSQKSAKSCDRRISRVESPSQRDA